MTSNASAPYKFLDSYKRDDRTIFFGRARETEILVADVVLSRLVVLFAKTGTGKTSLIEAAVRPALEERGFVTFRVRVRRDPTESARDELRERGLNVGARDSLETMLNTAAAEQPIVVFFDQFEEYFLYLAREDRERADRFIADLAALYDDRKSKVHVVLSMREDFYVELDEFRDRIPTIFHNDSSLRLQWFDPKQARAVIEGPARAAHVAIDPALLDRLVADLSIRHGRVEPAQLQIVCDTLWGKRSDEGLTLEGYLALGRSDSETTVAEQIVSDRLTEEFRSYESRSDLELIERLLEPHVLSTERGTKYARDVLSLVHLLSEGRTPPIEEDDLMQLLRRLAASRLVRLQIRDDVPHVELTHDYLVADPKRLDELRRTVRNIWPLRTLEAGVREWMEDETRFTGDTTDLESVLERVVAEWETTQHDGKPPTDRLPLTPDYTLLFLHLALQRGVHARAAFEIAVTYGVPALAVVLETMHGQHLDHAAYAMRLLGELRTSDAVEALHEALELPHLASEAQEQVTGIARSAAPVAEAAVQVLVEYLESLLAREELAPFALEDLGRLEHPAAVESLRKRLDDPQLADEATDALRRLTRSYNLEVAELADDALATSSVPLAPAVAPAPSPSPSWPGASATKRQQASLGGFDEAHFATIARPLLEQRVVIFLGPGASLAGAWSSGASSDSPPSRQDAARLLHDEFGLPESAGTSLAEVADAIEALFGSGPLYRSLHTLYARDFAPNSVHRFVAGLPRLLRNRVEAPGQLVVTTAFDDTLERSFDEADEPYSVVHYMADRDSGGRFALRKERDAAPRLLDERGHDVATALDIGSVILKINGSVDRTESAQDSFLVTHADFADFLAMRDPAGRLSVPLAAKLQRSHVLFLGYGLGDWTARIVLDRLLGERQRSYASWAVLLQQAGELDERRWRARNVELVLLDLEEYVTQFNVRLSDLGPAYA